MKMENTYSLLKEQITSYRNTGCGGPAALLKSMLCSVVASFHICFYTCCPYLPSPHCSEFCHISV